MGADAKRLLLRHKNDIHRKGNIFSSTLVITGKVPKKMQKDILYWRYCGYVVCKKSLAQGDRNPTHQTICNIENIAKKKHMPKYFV